MESKHATPYSEVNALLHEVLVGVEQILGAHFVGMYLEGSLVSDDFDQDSDIDFVVVSEQSISREQFAALQLMHQRISKIDSWYADQLEGFYVSQHALRRYVPAQDMHPNLERGSGEHLKLVSLDSSWLVHLSILRARGITLAGNGGFGAGMGCAKTGQPGAAAHSRLSGLRRAHPMSRAIHTAHRRGRHQARGGRMGDRDTGCPVGPAD